jgi:hypothetical protein
LLLFLNIEAISTSLFILEEEVDFVNVESAEAGAGSSEADLWARNSPLAADFEEASLERSELNGTNLAVQELHRSVERAGGDVMRSTSSMWKALKLVRAVLRPICGLVTRRWLLITSPVLDAL